MRTHSPILGQAGSLSYEDHFDSDSQTISLSLWTRMEPVMNAQEQNCLTPVAYWGAGTLMAASGAYLAMTGNYFGLILVAVLVVRVMIKLATGK